MGAITERTWIPIGVAVSACVILVGAVVWSFDQRSALQQEVLANSAAIRLLEQKFGDHSREYGHTGISQMLPKAYVPRPELEKDIDRFKEDVAEIKADIKEIKTLVRAIQVDK